METGMKAFVALTIISLCLSSASAKCNDHKDCNTCASKKSLFISCRWCPLTRQCHTVASVKNKCSKSQQVTEPEKCASVAEPKLSYNPLLAETLAKWSGAAYTRPEKKDASSFQAAVKSVIGSDYQVVEFVSKNCDVLFKYDDCAAVIGLSKANRRIIVAFRGSVSGLQVIEQGAQTATGMRDFPTGGKVLVYYRNAHNALYSCVKGVVKDLMKQNPGFKIAVTGHSLGGALAQLAAVSLVKENVANRDNLDVYTFGSPRVGNRDFAYAYDRLMGNSWRVVNTKDPVPLILPSHLLGVPFAYHTRREVYYTTQPMSPTTPYKLCLSNEDSSCAEHGITCLYCFDEHQMYFTSDLPGVISSKVKDGGNPPSKGTRDQCDTFKY